jgi:hypothetical protein
VRQLAMSTPAVSSGQVNEVHTVYSSNHTVFELLLDKEIPGCVVHALALSCLPLPLPQPHSFCFYGLEYLLNVLYHSV